VNGSTTDALNVFDDGQYANGRSLRHGRAHGRERKRPVLSPSETERRRSPEISGADGGRRRRCGWAANDPYGVCSLSADSSVASDGVLILPEDITLTIADSKN
jgi:hypothetical protein